MYIMFLNICILLVVIWISFGTVTSSSPLQDYIYDIICNCVQFIFHYNLMKRKVLSEQSFIKPSSIKQFSILKTTVFPNSTPEKNDHRTS